MQLKWRDQPWCPSGVSKLKLPHYCSRQEPSTATTRCTSIHNRNENNTVLFKKMSRATEESHQNNHRLSNQTTTGRAKDDVSGLTSLMATTDTCLIGEIAPRWEMQSKVLMDALIYIIKQPEWFGRFRFEIHYWTRNTEILVPIGTLLCEVFFVWKESKKNTTHKGWCVLAMVGRKG